MNQELYNRLVDDLIKYSDYYYNKHTSLINDKEFDMLLKKAEAMEAAHPEWIRPDSPSQKVGSASVATAGAKKHKRKMLSLENTYNKEEVEDWYNKMISYGVKSFVIEPKYDGVSFSARYKKGKLVLGLTRGDGEVGEDITQNLKLIADLNDNISSEFTGEVRGEIMMTLTEFKRINEDGRYANPRNLTSGTLKLLDPEEFKKRKLVAYTYWLEDSNSKRQSDDLELLKTYGFKASTYFLNFDFEDISEAIDKILELKKSGDFDVDLDGAVLKVDHKDLWEQIGGTSKFPHWAKAYKYDPETAVTRVKDVEFWVGHSGKITPVAILEPVELSGSTIQKVTLNNKGYMEEMDIQIGDDVNIKKAAEIIPFINYVVKENRVGRTLTPVKFPTFCPSCGTELKKYNDEHADYYCMNDSCKSRVIGTIVKYTSTMEIDGFAEIIVEKLYNAGLLCSVTDLYTLKDKKEQMVELDRMGDKLVTRLLTNIENSKTQSFEKFLAAISIKNAGKGTAKRLLKKYSNIDQIIAAGKEDLMQVEDIGDIVAQNIIDFFRENMDFINTLKGYGVNMEKEQTSKEIINTLNGKTFCITGALSKVRAEVEAMIESLGGKNVSGVTKKTDYLVTNDQITQTSKLIKAKELGVKIISEAELLSMLDV